MNGWRIGYKLFNLLARIPGLRQLFRLRAAQRLRETVYVRFVLGLPDRHYFDAHIIPRLREAAPPRMLFVGCAPYTAHYVESFQSAGIELWTMDLLPENAPYGAPGRHITGDLLEAGATFKQMWFDGILLNGVFGYGLNEPPLMERALHVLHGLLKPEGFLLVGWNRGLVPDPLTLGPCAALFEHTSVLGLPARHSFEKCTHVYDWFRARPG